MGASEGSLSPTLVLSPCSQAVLTSAWVGEEMTRFPFVQGAALTTELHAPGGSLSGPGTEHGLLA